MERSPKQVIQYLKELESAAEKVLTDKNHLINLDKRRQDTRQAISALQRNKTDEHTYVCLNNLFIELPMETTKKILRKDFDDVDTEYNHVRDNIKPLVNKLRDIESKGDAHGFNLNPLSKQEVETLRNLM